MNYFDYFGLSPRFDLDDAKLEEVWRLLQYQVHPDRFSTASAVEKRVAMQKATQINEAYECLKTPLSRAKYLYELRGAVIDENVNTALSTDFLMQQMQWHEALDEARESEQALFELQYTLRQERQALIDQVRNGFENESVSGQVAVLIQEWMFIEKLLSEIQVAIDCIADSY